MNSNGVSVYDKVLGKLKEMETPKIYSNQFYSLITNMKVNKTELICIIEESLKEAGLPVTQIERICDGISWKLRFTKPDAKAIEKHLIAKGEIKRVGCQIILLNGK